MILVLQSIISAGAGAGAGTGTGISAGAGLGNFRHNLLWTFQRRKGEMLTSGTIRTSFDLNSAIVMIALFVRQLWHKLQSTKLSHSLNLVKQWRDKLQAEAL
jgi:NAD-dependent SIR2 family protein deacetylase